jgi:hypothetical protein
MPTSESRTDMTTTIVRDFLLGCTLAVILTGCVSERVSYRRHPTLAEAQSFIQDAIDKVSAAQSANEFDMNGHAQRAKNLLSQAYGEVKLAAEAANSRY